MNGSEPMMPAEDLASMLIAWILARIFLRSRSTLARLPSASERLPPAFCWIHLNISDRQAADWVRAQPAIPDFAREDGAMGISLDTSQDTAAARALYRAAGWNEDATQWYSLGFSKLHH